jgi:hypothetical protein
VKINKSGADLFIDSIFSLNLVAKKQDLEKIIFYTAGARLLLSDASAAGYNLHV